MGNSFSTATETPQKEFQDFYEVIDYISTNYILTMDFKSLSKLSEKEYCDKIVLLSTDIIKNSFNDMEITYLQKRVKDGVDQLKTSDLKFINKEQLDEGDNEKMRKCMGIAKFYVKIAHLFAAIVMTINPVYKYKDVETGKMVQTGLLDKDKIPKNTQRTLHKFNICDNRIRSLKRGKTYMKATEETAVVFPKYCTLNYKDGELKDLEDEPGIKELLPLYLDDKYDYATGTFTGMSPETEKQFKKDLAKFYVAFTGNEVMPEQYNKFSDIKLKDYKSQQGCQGSKPIYKKIYTLPKTDDLFVSYASNIKQMVERAADKQHELLAIIDKLFKITNNKIRIHPDLTDEILKKAVEEAREIIIDLYVQCEEDYVKGLKIYESIVESKILDTTPKQIKTLQDMSNKILEETKSAAPKEEVPLLQVKEEIVQEEPVNIN
jgi:hypothetical protein